MATLITDKNRNLLLPKSDFLLDYWDWKFYSLPWATIESPLESYVRYLKLVLVLRAFAFLNFKVQFAALNTRWKAKLTPIS